MPKRLFKSKRTRNDTKKPKKNKGAKVQTATHALFPQSTSEFIKFKVEQRQKKKKKSIQIQPSQPNPANKLHSKLHSHHQRKQHHSFISRQNDTSLSPHQRIQELLRSTKKSKHSKRAQKKKANQNEQLEQLETQQNSKHGHTHNSHDSTRNKPKNKSGNMYNKQPTEGSKESNIKPLDGAQFRWMNQMLYNTTGRDAKQKIQEHKQEFSEYHQIYNDIVSNEWPESPLEKLIRSILKKLSKWKKLKQSSRCKVTVADFGCGDAKIAKYFYEEYDKRTNAGIEVEVRSFDLIALNEYVTACDIARVPLESESVDMALFCLSLMGTNFHDYLIEAHRVLKPQGFLKIAEVRSRFYGFNKFERFLNRCGFDLVAKDLDNTHFALFHCVKSEHRTRQTFPAEFNAQSILKPCVYKRR